MRDQIYWRPVKSWCTTQLRVNRTAEVALCCPEGCSYECRNAIVAAADADSYDKRELFHVGALFFLFHSWFSMAQAPYAQAWPGSLAWPYAAAGEHSFTYSCVYLRSLVCVRAGTIAQPHGSASTPLSPCVHALSLCLSASCPCVQHPSTECVVKTPYRISCISAATCADRDFKYSDSGAYTKQRKRWGPRHGMRCLRCRSSTLSLFSIVATFKQPVGKQRASIISRTGHDRVASLLSLAPVSAG